MTEKKKAAVPAPDPVRPASSPIMGSVRDAVRTFVAFLVAFVFVKLGALVPGVDLASAQEAIVVNITSAVLAFAVKAMRGAGVSLGKVI